jgi:hypothetical protein
MTKDIIDQLHNAVALWKKNREELAQYLLEIDRRKLWWQMGYSSFYKFCEQEFKYSPEEIDEILEDLENT